MNPLAPTALDVLLSAVVVASWIFAAVALVSAFRARHLTGARFFLWFAAIALLPIAGATAWFVKGRVRKVTLSPLDILEENRDTACTMDMADAR